MSQEREPPGDELMFDTQGFAGLVEVIAVGSEQMSALVNENPVPSPYAPDGFGDLARAWGEFHRAWNGESVTSARGLASFAERLQQAGIALTRADELGGAAVKDSQS
ncbi:hypothetical protein ACFROC_07530 [Nocardia tengchongensis]|uniref:hypothetical protein n=1 Tax=Nocardia tengchongensis TaxID=2055889 RepID=UPI00369F5377